MERTSEAFELLALSKSTSSDESSLNLSLKRKQRRRRSRSGNTYRVKTEREKDASTHAKYYFPALSVFTLGLIGWVLTLTWIAVQLRLEMQNLTNLTTKVTAGNEAIPDAIQKCHNLTKQLEQNQTRIITELQQVVQKLTDFSGMIQGIETGLSSVKKQLNGSPDLLSIPKTVHELTDSIANIGGQLNDFNITTMKVSNEQKKISEQIDSINKNLSFYNLLQEEIEDWKNSSHGKNAQSDLINNETVIQSALNRITSNMSSLNITLWKKIDNILKNQTRSQDTINDLKSRLEKVDEKQDLQDKFSSKTIKDIPQLQNDVYECKNKSDTNAELLRNLSQQVITCTCQGGGNLTNGLHLPSPAPGTESTANKHS